MNNVCEHAEGSGCPGRGAGSSCQRSCGVEDRTTCHGPLGQVKPWCRPGSLQLQPHILPVSSILLPLLLPLWLPLLLPLLLPALLLLLLPFLGAPLMPCSDALF